MEYTTIRNYDLWIKDEHFQSTREEAETRTKRIETLVLNMEKKGWQCKLCRKSDGYNSGLYGVIHERFRDTIFWSNIGEVNGNQIMIIGEHPEIHKFLAEYDFKHTEDMSLKERKRIYYENGM